MAQLKDRIRNVIKDSIAIIKLEIEDSLKKQGHTHTGALAKSLEANTVIRGDEVSGEVYLNSYFGYVEKGVRSSRIPYDGSKRTGAKRSKYIEALISYFRFKGKSNTEAKSAAFATAKIHAKEGMPTKGSERFSQTGKRIGFIDESTRVSKEIELAQVLVLEQIQIETELVLDNFQKGLN